MRRPSGLKLPAFKKALKDAKYSQQVQTDIELGKEANVSGTPTMFLNGERVANATAFEPIAAMIDKALSEG